MSQTGMMGNPKIKIRLHRSGLRESMETVQEIEATAESIVSYLKSRNNILSDVRTEEIDVQPYGFDDRIGWNTHAVTVAGQIIGFTNGPLAPRTPPTTKRAR